ncbi:hypothetical protein VTN77DRAFT_5722 [Rasamsonia byssochlamydoides]|uniref:uncharacterized protein n=1 Tax=Rasamsonia byssochlamydoides TaxID=89139 RepID=UPI003741F0F3
MIGANMVTQFALSTAVLMLAGCASGIGFVLSPKAKDLHLAATLGLDADTVLLNHARFRQAVANLRESDIPTEWATIPIDHDDYSVGTYQNRYWVTTEYYQPGGPVFVYDVGESSAEDAAQVLLVNSSQFFVPFLEEFHGIGIVWEHRYYGDSLPFPVNVDTPPEYFQYLTNRQALADLPYFAQNFSRAEFPNQDLTPKSTPWVMVGGSYSGMRSAFSRNEYPDTFFAAYASSAPVQARINMSIYFEQVYRGMVAYGYGNCAKDLHAAHAYIDQELAQNDTAAAAIKRLFLGAGAENNTNADFTFAIDLIYSNFQSYGMGGGNTGLASLCEYLENPATNQSTAINQTAPADGWAPYIGNKAVAERLASWPNLVPLVNGWYDINCKGLDTSQPVSCQLGQPTTDPDMISWMWQYCSQWGFFQSNNFGPHALLSRYETLEYNQLLCYRQFPGAVESGVLPVRPDVDGVNQETGGWTIRPSNVYWSGGEFDPWRTLSPLSTEAFAQQGVNFTTAIPKCGVRTSEDELFGYIMKDAEHCFDFNTQFAGGAASRANFVNALHEWLPCWTRT